LTGSFPQVNETYAFVEGLYGIMNEHQLAIGESTCGSRFVALAKGFGGQALFHISSLTTIALERCKTAREAIQLMGDLAVEYGYYSANNKNSEGGEALVISDTMEVWVFHISPDDTGASAVWAAQRVPDDHISVVANSFVIRKIDPESEDFMFSSNIFNVAIRNNLYDPNNDLLDFAEVYGYSLSQPLYSTRRVWRVFELANPELNLPADTTPHTDDYPFSIKPNRLLTVEDLLIMNRDHYEGTEFDLTKGLAAGPFGDPTRYDSAANQESGLTIEELRSGRFERAISMFRTSYSFVTQSRKHLPNEVGGVIWYAQYAPHAATYVPIYISVDDIPEPYRVGSLFKYSSDSMFWRTAIIGNWIQKSFQHIIGDVKEVQVEIESDFFTNQANIESQVLALLSQNNTQDVVDLLSDYSSTSASRVFEAYGDLFPKIVTKYHDGYRMEKLDQLTIEAYAMFYPKWWLEMVGYWPTTNNHNTNNNDKPCKPEFNHYEIQDSLKVLILIVVAITCLSLGFFGGRLYYGRRKSYFSINSSPM